MVEAISVEGRDPATTVAELEHHAAPVLAPGDGLEGCLPVIVSTPGQALAVLDGKAMVGVLRIEEVQHLLGETRDRGRPRNPAGGRS